ncbi:hypothetical protein AKJ09_03304 [Labilithrix luteola]|uniref:Lipoprotein n=1 Tax=Labilithrix luteola TaxID=1391654 RepID=A0A0K1PSW8_9BACT|nr:hypothetical protein AKJ09_03304 [Labilithrix luteola]
MVAVSALRIAAMVLACSLSLSGAFAACAIAIRSLPQAVLASANASARPIAIRPSLRALNMTP